MLELFTDTEMPLAFPPRWVVIMIAPFAPREP